MEDLRWQPLVTLSLDPLSRALEGMPAVGGPFFVETPAAVLFAAASLPKLTG